MTEATVFGTNYREIIISLVLLYPPKRKANLSAYGGQRHKRYLQEHKKAFYSTLLTSGKLNSYLADIDKQAEDMFFRLVEQMKQAGGITEQLKTENPMLWVGRMNEIQAREKLSTRKLFKM